MSKTKALSRKAQGEETRAIVISTAARLFAMNGFHGVSMRMLAAEAGVNLASVGYHFGGKAGLYEAIIREIIAARESFFPTEEETLKRMEQAGSNITGQCEVVNWYVRTLVIGLLGQEEYKWPAFLLSRELAQPSDHFPLLEEQFFDPSFASLTALVKDILPEETSPEELIIVAQCVIGVVVKFLEGQELLLKRLGWAKYAEDNLEVIATILSKRIRGLLGLPMETK